MTSKSSKICPALTGVGAPWTADDLVIQSDYMDHNDVADVDENDIEIEIMSDYKYEERDVADQGNDKGRAADAD